MKYRVMLGLGIVVALALALWIGKCASKGDYEDRLAEWRSRAQVAEQAATAAKAEADAAKRIAAEHSREDAALADSLAALESRLDAERAAKVAALAQARKNLAAASDTGALRQAAREFESIAERVIEENDTITRHLSRARATIQRGIEDRAMLVGVIRRLETSNDSLVALVRTVPTHEGDRLLGLIPLPSRTASFAIGGVTFTVLTLWVMSAF